MAWNEPDKDKDPWGAGDKRAPELDEIVRKLNRRFGSLLGGGGGDGGGAGGNKRLVGLVLLVLAAIFVVSGFYTVDAGSRGVVQRFGEFHAISVPGLRWRPPIVDTVTIVNSEKVQEFNHSSMMLTGDANIIDIDINVQYRQVDPVKYVFNVRNPDESLKEVTEAAIRGVAGKYDMEDIQTTLRNDVAIETRAEIQRILDRYDVGIEVTNVNLNNTEFPRPVRDAVQDVIKASRDQERYILEAESYRNDVLPKARGEASRIVEDARGYREGLIADASGDADRFKQILVEYEMAPEVTRERLYLETVEQVYGNTSKVLLGGGDSGGNSLMYLPLDKLMERGAMQGGANGRQPNVSAVPQSNPAAPTTSRSRDTSSRSRTRDRQ